MKTMLAEPEIVARKGRPIAGLLALAENPRPSVYRKLGLRILSRVGMESPILHP